MKYFPIFKNKSDRQKKNIKYHGLNDRIVDSQYLAKFIYFQIRTELNFISYDILKTRINIAVTLPGVILYQGKWFVSHIKKNA